jgi:hypothetical protein
MVIERSKQTGFYYICEAQFGVGTVGNTAVGKLAELTVR